MAGYLRVLYDDPAWSSWTAGARDGFEPEAVRVALDAVRDFFCERLLGAIEVEEPPRWLKLGELSKPVTFLVGTLAHATTWFPVFVASAGAGAFVLPSRRQVVEHLLLLVAVLEERPVLVVTSSDHRHVIDHQGEGAYKLLDQYQGRFREATELLKGELYDVSGHLWGAALTAAVNFASNGSMILNDELRRQWDEVRVEYPLDENEMDTKADVFLVRRPRPRLAARRVVIDWKSTSKDCTTLTGEQSKSYQRELEGFSGSASLYFIHGRVDRLGPCVCPAVSVPTIG